MSGTLEVLDLHCICGSLEGPQSTGGRKKTALFSSEVNYGKLRQNGSSKESSLSYQLSGNSTKDGN